MADIDLDKYTNAFLSLRKGLRKSVFIEHDQVLKIVLEDLISKRNGIAATKREGLQHFDYVLRWYMDEDEFQKYVINKEPLDI